MRKRAHTSTDVDNRRSNVRPDDDRKASNSACRSGAKDAPSGGMYLLPTERPAPAKSRRGGSSFIRLEAE